MVLKAFIFLVTYVQELKYVPFMLVEDSTRSKTLPKNMVNYNLSFLVRYGTTKEETILHLTDFTILLRFEIEISGIVIHPKY